MIPFPYMPMQHHCITLQPQPPFGQASGVFAVCQFAWAASRTTAHRLQQRSNTATQQRSNSTFCRLRVRPRRPNQGIKVSVGGPARACISARARNFIGPVKLDRVTFWNVSEHSAPSTGLMPHSRAPRVNTEQARKVSLRVCTCVPCVPCAPVSCCLQPSPASPLTPSVFSVSLGS